MKQRKIKKESVQCSECGLSYIFPSDKREHTIYHRRYLKASKRFGRILFYLEREALKGDANNILHGETSVPEKVAAVEQSFQAYFSRSVQSSGFDLRHPAFPYYCAMLLNQKHWENFLQPYPGVYKELVNKYGLRAGIYEGMTNYPLRRVRPLVTYHFQ